jgi:hypothetical protein
MRHSDAGVKKCPSTRMRAKALPQLYRAYISLPAVSLKGQSRRSDCAPVTSGLPEKQTISAPVATSQFCQLLPFPNVHSRKAPATPSPAPQELDRYSHLIL